MITGRREIGQWLAFAAVTLLVVAVVYLLVAELVVGAAPCACTQAPPPSAGRPTG